MTDQTGKAEFQINKDILYTIRTSKDGYRTFTQKISAAGKSNGDSVVSYSLLKPDAQLSISKGATNNLSLENYIIFTDFSLPHFVIFFFGDKIHLRKIKESLSYI